MAVDKRQIISALRSWLIPVAVVILLIPVGRYGYLRLKYPMGDILGGVPVSSVLVIEGEGFLSFAGDVTGSDVWAAGFSNLGQEDHLKGLLHQIDEFTSGAEEDVASVFRENRYCMVLVPRKREGPGLLFLLQPVGGRSPKKTRAGLSNFFAGFQEKRLLEISYFEKDLGDGELLYVTLHKGLILASTSREVFELAYYTLESGNSIVNDPVFMQVREQISKSRNQLQRCYISHEAMFGWFSRYIHPESRGMLAAIPGLGEWSAFEIQNEGTQLHLQGITLNTRTGRAGSLMTGGIPMADPGVVLPMNTLFYDQTAISGYREYSSTLSVNHTGINAPVDAGEAAPVIPVEAVDTARMLMEEMEIRSLIYAITSPTDTLSVSGGLFLLHSGRIAHASRAAILLADTSFMVEHQGYRLYPLARQYLLPELFGARLNGFGEAWFTICDEYVIFAPGIQGLLSAVNNIILRRTLAETPGYEDMNSRVEGALSKRYYFSSTNGLLHLKSISSTDQFASVERFLQFMPGQGLITFLQDNDVILTDMVLIARKGNSNAEASREIVLDGIPVQSPVVFTDHRTKERKAVFADHNGNIYLINLRGEIEWKMLAREAPASSIHVIDMYRNGRQQCLFLSRNMLHIIQADGQYVQGYSLALPDGFISNLSVLDYEQNGNYRLIYLDEKGVIANTDLGGRKVSGWLSPEISGLQSPVRWVRAGGLDFLVAADQEGLLHLYDRRGKERFPDARLGSMMPHSDIVVTRSLGEEYITFLNHEGDLCQVSRTGVLHNHEVLRFADGSKLVRPFGEASYTRGFLVFEPERYSVYDQELRLTERRDVAGFGVRTVNRAEGIREIMIAGTDNDGTPFVLKKDQPDPVFITASGYDGVLLVGDSGRDGKLAMVFKGSLIRIVPF